MKNKFAYALFVMIMGAALIACPDDPVNKDPENKNPESVTVTFNKNNTDEEGASEAVPRTRTTAFGSTVELPEPPTRSLGWNAGMTFDGWYTLASGGTVFTADTKVTKNITVYARWKFVAGTPTVVEETLVHIAPQVGNNTGDGGVQGTWAGTMNEDGSVTYTNGAIRYQFPSNIADYDYFTLEYVASDTLGVILKQYNNSSDYLRRDANQYPPLQPSGSFECAVAGAGSSNGIALQRNTGSENPQGERTVKITQVTFTKGIRYTINFNCGAFGQTPYGGTDPQPAQIKVSEGAAIGTLPVLTWTGYNFLGWFKGETRISPTDAATPDFDNATLTARWEERAPIKILPHAVTFAGPGDFTKSDSSATVTVLAGGNGYTYEYGTAQYQDAWTKFNVDFGEGITIGDYATVTFKLTGKQGDTAYKPVILLAGKPLPERFASQPNVASQYAVSTAQLQYNTGEVTITFDIDKSKAIELKHQVIEMAIYIHAGKENSGTSTIFEIKDIVFTPAPVLWKTLEKDGDYKDGSAIWNWIATDEFGQNGIKGRLQAAFAAEIKSVPNSEVWVYWSGSSTSTGQFGTFGGVALNKTAGESGIIKIPAVNIQLLTGSNEGQIDINVWANTGSITKIEIYHPG